MSDSITPSLSDVMASIRTFISAVLPVPEGTQLIEVIQGLDNRVPMPQNPFVAMTYLNQRRLSWNRKRYTDTVDTQAVRIVMHTSVNIQLDCYGVLAGEWAAMLATLFFDETAFDALKTLGKFCEPLYISDPVLMPFVNAEAQWQPRWRLDLTVQVNFVTTQLQQFADKADVGLVDVDVVFPVSDISSSHITIDSSAGT